MANVVLIMGKSGTGKSTSIKSLDPKETVIFNVLKKRLPFKGSSKVYNEASKNLFNISDWQTIVQYMKGLDKAAQYKNLVIDDMTYVMRKEYFKTASQTGYSKYSNMAAHFQSIIEEAENMRDDLNVFFIMHCEEVESDGSVVGYKPSTVGKLIDNSYNPVEVVPILLFSDVSYDEQKNPQYGFYTNRTVKGNIIIPAKSPEGMFDELFIPNDLKLVTDKMKDYYE